MRSVAPIESRLAQRAWLLRLIWAAFAQHDVLRVEVIGQHDAPHLQARLRLPGAGIHQNGGRVERIDLERRGGAGGEASGHAESEKGQRRPSGGG